MMKRSIIYIVMIIFAITIFTGCSKSKIKDIDDEIIETFEVIKSEDNLNQPNTELDDSANEQTQADNTDAVEISEKFKAIDFYFVSGIYSRNIMQEDVEVLEMFALDRNSFVRVASNDMEKEVYAYNYISDDFTYLYYFDGELMLRTVINVATGAAIEDSNGNASTLLEDSADLKEYFYSLIELADIEVSELES